MGPIAKSTIKTSFVLGLRLMVQAATLLLVARMLGAEQFGYFAGVAALAVLMGALANLGSNWVLLGLMSESPEYRKDVLPWAIPATLVFGAVLLCMFILIAVIFLNTSAASLMAILAIGAAEIWLQPLFSLAVTEYHALGRVALSQTMQILPLFLRTLVALAVYFAAPAEPLLLYSIGYFFASLISLKFILGTLETPWPDFGSWRYPYYDELKRTLGFAISNFTRSIPGEIDKVIASRLLPPGLGGVYTAAVRTVTALVLPVSAMMLSALPRLFRGILADSLKLHVSIYIAAIIYSVFISLFVWYFSPLFNILFGDDYQSIDAVFRWLCLVIPGIALRVVSGNILISLRKPWIKAFIELQMVLIIFIASLTLIPRFGIAGMVISLAISEWTMAVMGIVVVVFLHSRDFNKRSI